MIDNQQTAIFKSNQDFNKNKEKISQYIKYAENYRQPFSNRIKTLIKIKRKFCNILNMHGMITRQEFIVYVYIYNI